MHLWKDRTLRVLMEMTARSLLAAISDTGS